MYTELKEIGRGPHATVYRARDSVLERDLAIKELALWSERPAPAVARFRFAQAQGLLRHPHLLDCHVVDAERGRLAMEFMAEGSLASRIERDGPLSSAAVRKVLIGTLEALVHLHYYGLVHGAVKPSNLFLDGKGHVFLADGLGLPFTKKRTVYPQPLTADDEKYLAPEGETAPAPAADLYSLGLALLELLLANDFELLFPEVLGRAMTWAQWHRSDRQLPPVETLVQGLPRDLAVVVNRLLRKQPQERYATAADALDAVRPAPHGYRRWGGPALVAGGCVAAVILAVLLVVRPWQTEVTAAPAAQTKHIEEIEKQRDQARAELATAKKELTEARKKIEQILYLQGILAAEREAARQAAEQTQAANKKTLQEMKEEIERLLAAAGANTRDFSIGAFFQGHMPLPRRDK